MDVQIQKGAATAKIMNTLLPKWNPAIEGPDLNRLQEQLRD
jgi:hypothetical protein